MKVLKMMIIIAVFLIAFAGLANAVDWQTANQVTVAWDAVPPIQPTDTISYIVYTRFEDGSNQSSGEEVMITQATITFSVEGKYHVGVATKRVVEDGEILISDINWSDTDGEFTPNPFGIKFYVKPNMPKGLVTQ
jgi:hypothetical protein